MQLLRRIRPTLQASEVVAGDLCSCMYVTDYCVKVGHNKKYNPCDKVLDAIQYINSKVFGTI
jgi:hypothetical protein